MGDWIMDNRKDPFCGVDGCNELARYVEVGDGHALEDPRLRCHGHKPTGGLWRDMRVAVRSCYERYLTPGGKR